MSDDGCFGELSGLPHLGGAKRTARDTAKTVQYLITEGRTFTALQQRDMRYAVSAPDRSGMVCRLTSTDRAHHFRLVSGYITDPPRDSVVVRTKLEPLSGLGERSIRNLRVYVRSPAGAGTTPA